MLIFPIKCQEYTKKFGDRNTKYRFGVGIFLVYQIFGYRLASLVHTYAYLRWISVLSDEYEVVWI